MNKTMDEVREDCLKRIEGLSKAVRALSDGAEAIDSAGEEVSVVWEGWPDPYKHKTRDIEAVVTLVEVVRDRHREDLLAAASQAGKLVARDVIAPIARSSTGPIEWLTGNSYMPPLRSLNDAGRIWNADQLEGEVWEAFTEALTRALDDEQVYMAQPDYDNALYVVDLKRWTYVENAEGDDLNDEWTAVRD